MSFNQVITSPQYTTLRQNAYQADQLISLVDNVVAFAASVASTQPSTTGSTSAHLPYTSVTIGSYTNLDEGMVCVVSPTSDPRFPTAMQFRLRLDSVAGAVADSSNIYINEFSDILSTGMFITVYYAYNLDDSLSRPVGTAPVVQEEDYNQPYETMKPVVRGTDTSPLQTAYAKWVDSAGHYDIAFDASGSFSPESGGSIASYLYSVVATGAGTFSVIAGSAATATVTYRFTYGEYWVKLVVTDGLGVKQYRHILVKAHDPTNYPPQAGFEGVEITRDIVQGPSARVKYYEGVSTLIDGTMAVIWVNELYSDGPDAGFSNPSGSLFGNIDLIGWIETEEDQFQTDPTYSAYSEVSFEIQGVAARLSRIEGQLLAITNAATPTLWDQIKNLTPWRAVVHFLQHHTQALNLCDFTSNDLTDTYKFPTITTIAGNALDNLTGQQGVASQIRSQLEFARDGRIQLVTRADFVTAYQSVLTRVATWTGDDITGQFTYKYNQYPQYGFVNADGAAWDGSSATVTPYLSRAPGLAQGPGAEQGQFNNQILAVSSSPAGSQTELNGYSGIQFGILNNTYELSLTFFDGYWWLETSYNQIYTINLNSTYFVTGRDLNDFNWMVKSVTVRHDNEKGNREVQVVFIAVSTGGPGVTVPIINNTSVTPPVIIPPFPANPFEPPEVTIPDPGLPSSPVTPPTTDRQGQIVLEVNAAGSALSITQNYITLAAPTWRSYTPPLPSGYTLVDACFDQLGSTGGAVAVYALGNNGTDSIIFYNANVMDGSSPWTQTGTPFTGVYTVIRSSGTPGSVLVYSATDGAITKTTFDFTINNQGWSLIPTAGDTGHVGTYVASIGWESTCETSGGEGFAHILIGITLPGTTNLLRMETDYSRPSASIGANLAGSTANVFATDADSTVISTTGGDLVSGTMVSLGFFASIQAVGFSVYAALHLPDCVSPPVVTVPQVRIWTSAGGNANVRLSSDYGATVGSPLDLASSAGSAGGFDLARVNGVSYAAASAEVRKASTIGGAYSSFAASLGGNPTSICIPYYQVGSNTTTQTTSSTPQVVIGLDTQVGGTCLYWLNGSGTPTAITTPASGAIIDHPDCVSLLRGTHIAVIVNVSGTQKLYVAHNLAGAGTATWTFIKNVGPSATLRTRRNDPRLGNAKGQLYVFDTPSGYSSAWASASEWSRVSPSGQILAGDVLG